MTHQDHDPPRGRPTTCQNVIAGPAAAPFTMCGEPYVLDGLCDPLVRRHS